ncbi:7626_t:CDS:2, partial [Racocetra persica]
DSEFYLQLNSDWMESELLTNHSGQKTVAQCLQDRDISEQAIMQLMGHKSVQGIHAYKQVNEDQQLNTINTLINITDGSANNNDNNNNISSQTPLQKITNNMNFTENSFNSSNEKILSNTIFNNCSFTNVTFNIQK